jgi:hypothetical protein
LVCSADVVVLGWTVRLRLGGLLLELGVNIVVVGVRNVSVEARLVGSGLFCVAGVSVGFAGWFGIVVFVLRGGRL